MKNTNINKGCAIMKVAFIFFGLGFMPSYIFANDFSHTDFIPRVINFAIFAVIVYIVLQPKISAFFQNRVDGIRDSIEKANEEREESKRALLAKKKELKDIEEQTKEMINQAKAQAKKILSDLETAKANENEIQSKNNELKKQAAANRFKREVVSQFLDNTIQADKIGLKDSELTSLILKKAI